LAVVARIVRSQNKPEVMKMPNVNSFDQQWMGALVGARPATAPKPLPDPDDCEIEPEEERPQMQDLRALYPSPEPACSREQFLKDVAQHKMEVLRDDGVYRHLRFKRPGSNNYYFNLVTWPGHLAISGDGGDFMFTRSHDMFRFFRPDDWEKQKGDFFINPGYWGEKCVARDRGGMDEYRPETFKAQIADWCADDEEMTPELWNEIVSNVIRRADDGYHDAVQAAMDFEDEDGHCYFQDFWERDCTEWTYTYLWCLYAIVWGIFQYDLEKARLEALAVEDSLKLLNRLRKILGVKK
jgi:hypothetical protein